MKIRLAKCPECGGELTYEKGFPGTYWEPPEPELLYCEQCEWEADDGDLDNYIVYQE